jgi:peptidoglycan/LPS O-acetylase OafA/YrhL
LNRRLSGALDFARWIAALLVLFTHTANLMVARLADTPATDRTPILYGWVFLGGFGSQSVTVFFVLSGFLVGGRLLEKARASGSIEWLRYVLDRLVRIELVLIPALCLTFVADRVAAHFLPSVMAPFVGAVHTSWIGFFGNIFNLQNFYVEFFGSDGPIGTLANEFWYYFTFPLLLGPLLFRRPPWQRAALFSTGLLLCFLCWQRQSGHLFGFILWGLGVVSASMKRPLTRSVRLAAALAFLIPFTTRLVMRREMSGVPVDLFLSNLCVALGFANLLLTLRFASDPRNSIFYAPLHKRLAGFSYSLYACHMPLLFLLTAIFKVYTGFGTADAVTSTVQWIYVLSTLILTIATAYLVSLVTERHTQAVRQNIYRLFGVEWRRPLSSGMPAVPSPPHPGVGQEPDR